MCYKEKKKKRKVENKKKIKARYFSERNFLIGLFFLTRITVLTIDQFDLVAHIASYLFLSFFYVLFPL